MDTRLQQATGFLGGLGLILGAVQNFTNLSAALRDNFWSVYIVALALLLYSVWPEPPEKENLRIIPQEGSTWSNIGKRFIRVVLVCVFGAFVAAHHIWDTNRSVTAPHPYPNPTKPIGLNVIGRAYAAAPPSPKIISFGLQTSKTSFEERLEPSHAGGKSQRLRTFLLSYNNMNYIWQGRCTPDFALRESSVRQSLTNFAKENQRTGLMQYIPDAPRPLASLVHERPDITQELLPRSDEWERMAPNVRDDVLFFIKACIGIPYPVFLISFENKRAADLVITGIVYSVRAIGGVKGGESGPLGPKVTYIHKLDYKVGDQRQQMDSPFRIAANSASSFGVQLWTDHPDIGMSWTMKIRLETNQGRVETDEFQLIMSGQPEWAKGKFK